MNSSDQFHDSESEDVGDVTDVYDLFNALNGEVQNAVLNIQRLEELSQEEREVLDIARLKELAIHVASGCARCGAIINTLNLARRALRVGAEVDRREQVPKADAKNVD